jgi:anaerobic dimethyl sulfoxide reductase subunit A
LSGIAEVVDIPDYETLKMSGIYMVAQQDSSFIESSKSVDESKNKKFRSPSGRIDLYSQIIANLNDPKIPPVPKYIETWEGPTDPVRSKYPLQLITPHFKRRAHTQFDNLPWLQDLQAQVVSINSTDAESRGIQDGCLVKVFNDRGRMIIRARVTERIMPGVVAIPEGAWYTPDENGNDRGGAANILTRNVTSPAGAFPSNTALVEVERYNG